MSLRFSCISLKFRQRYRDFLPHSNLFSNSVSPRRSGVYFHVAHPSAFHQFVPMCGGNQFVTPTGLSMRPSTCLITSHAYCPSVVNSPYRRPSSDIVIKTFFGSNHWRLFPTSELPPTTPLLWSIKCPARGDALPFPVPPADPAPSPAFATLHETLSVQALARSVPGSDGAW